MKKSLLFLFTAMLMMFLVVGCSESDPTSESSQTDQDSSSEQTAATDEPASEDASEKEQPLEKVKLRLNWILYGEHSPFFVALEKGFYEEAGLDVTIDEGDGSASTVKLVANKSYDIGYADGSTTVKGTSNGMPVKIIGSYMQKNPSSIIFKKGLDIKTPEDLVGKSIALTQGDAPSQILDALFELNGIDPSKVKKVSVGTPPAKEAAMLTGKADSFIGFYHDQAPRIEVAQDVELDYLRYSDFGITMLATGLIAHNDTIKERPEVLKKFIEASNRGWKFTQENPEEAAKIFLEYAPDLNEEIATNQTVRMVENLHTENSQGQPLGWMAPEDQQSTVDLLQQYGDMGGSSNIEDYFTNELIPE